MVSCVILPDMINYTDEKILSELLKALSDTTRRALLTQITQQEPYRVTDLAKFYDMSLNAISKHIKILESANLIKRTKIGRTHWIEANLGQIKVLEYWFADIKSIWELRLDKLSNIIQTEIIGNKNE